MSHGKAREASLISVKCMKLRDLGNSYGFTVDKEALEELGLIDERGDLEEGVTARMYATEDGTIRYEIEGVSVVGD